MAASAQGSNNCELHTLAGLLGRAGDLVAAKSLLYRRRPGYEARSMSTQSQAPSGCACAFNHLSLFSLSLRAGATRPTIDPTHNAADRPALARQSRTPAPTESNYERKLAVSADMPTPTSLCSKPTQLQLWAPACDPVKALAMSPKLTARAPGRGGLCEREQRDQRS